MEEYITRAEFEQFKKQIEQMTEPMRAINVNVASQDVVSRLDGIQEYFSQELKTVSDTWLLTLQEHYTEHKQDISDVQTVLKGHAKFFEEHGKRLAAMATKGELRSELSAVEGRINTNISAMEQHLTRTITELLRQKPLPPSDQEQQ